MHCGKSALAQYCHPVDQKLKDKHHFQASDQNEWQAKIIACVWRQIPILTQTGCRRRTIKTPFHYPANELTDFPQHPCTLSHFDFIFFPKVEKCHAHMRDTQLHKIQFEESLYDTMKLPV